jgi:hypothetical protein
MIERARPRITEAVSAAILPFIFPGVLPSRDEYLRLDRWALSSKGPLIVSVLALSKSCIRPISVPARSSARWTN